MIDKDQQERFKKSLKLTRTEILKCLKIIDDMFEEVMKELDIKNNTDLYDSVFDYVYNYPDNRQAAAMLRRCNKLYKSNDKT